MTRVLSLAAVVGLFTVAAVLHAADPKPDAGAAGNILKPANDVKNWRLEQHESAKGTIAVEGDAIVFDVTETGDDWHLQAFQTPLDLKNDAEYAVTFKAKAGEERPVRVQAGIDEEDWHNIGLDEEVTLGKEWKDYEYKFTATDVRPMKNRVGFVMGMAKGKVFVKDLVVKPAKK